jgi:protein ImuB
LLAARVAGPILDVDDLDEFFALAPLAALEPSPLLLDIMTRWGIRTVGEFLALGRDAVTERLGAEALALFERVSRESVRPLKLTAPPEEFAEQTEFESEIETAAPLLFVLRRFVEQLSRRLQLNYLVVAELDLQLGLASGDRHQRAFKIPSPTGKVETLFRILQTHLDGVRTDSPIISLQLAAKPAVPAADQFGLFESALRDPNRFAETLGRLGALLGPENVGAPVAENTHRPDSFRMTPPEFERVPAQSSMDAANGLALRRFRPPMPAHFEFREEKPALLRSGIFNGAIAEWRGPFVSSGQWWDPQRWAREEWDVATASGPLLRIFISGEGCFVEGIYD